MNTNHERKNNQLSDTLTTFFSKNINLAHIKLILMFMMALCKARAVCFSKLSTCFDSPAKADSCLRRIQRFFSEHSISQNLVAKFIFQQLPRKEKYRLAIDRTNWQFGKTDINIFMLAVIHDGVAYPLLFSMLSKKGTSTRRSASTSCNATSTSSEGRPSTAFSPIVSLSARDGSTGGMVHARRVG